MERDADHELTPADRVNDLPRILSAMQQAVREALLRHKRLGQRIVVWRNGRVEWIEPQDIPVEDDDRDNDSDGPVPIS